MAIRLDGADDAADAVVAVAAAAAVALRSSGTSVDSSRPHPHPLWIDRCAADALAGCVVPDTHWHRIRIRPMNLEHRAACWLDRRLPFLVAVAVEADAKMFDAAAEA